MEKAIYKPIVTGNLIDNQGCAIDLGKTIAAYIEGLPSRSRLALKVKDFVDKLLQSAGHLIVLRNPGVLLEEELKLDVARLLTDHARNNTLILEWKGYIDNNTLYFLTHHHGKKIDLSAIGFEYKQTYEV
ncbi:hypothetical protein [Pontibacter lucknowensis]|uniref:Uncharacterized protein n=1 Tax=Pontibacter lucknowensis TaxID=1077936 RepID=A0A1N6TIK8_9BACT|nr:hypothetical protein [Pontibacter lucknowensis]SIQ53222.1 hypothetical protein SAMN05421545_0353 [Pontibacter lucknowensis]